MAKFKTECGGFVEVSRRTFRHLAAHPEAVELLEKAIGMISLPDSGVLVREEIDMGMVVGTNSCVKVANVDTLHFSVRIGRKAPSHVLPGQEPEATNLFSLIVGKQENGSWVLFTAYVGPLAPREPHDQYFDNKRNSDEFRESVNFWTTHGLCVGVGWGPVFESTWDEVIEEINFRRKEG